MSENVPPEPPPFDERWTTDPGAVMPDSIPMDEFLDAKKDALIDGLTKAGNFTAMEDRLQKLFMENETNVGILMLDATNFKSINEGFGHDAGDSFLRRIVMLLQDHLKEAKVYRRGGDEFVVLLENIPDREAMDGIGKRLVTLFNQDSYSDEQIIPSISIGGFYLGEHATDDERMVCLKAADEAQGVAKIRQREEGTTRVLRGQKNGHKVEVSMPYSGYDRYEMGKDGYSSITTLLEAVLPEVEPSGV